MKGGEKYEKAENLSSPLRYHNFHIPLSLSYWY